MYGAKLESGACWRLTLHRRSSVDLEATMVRNLRRLCCITLVITAGLIGQLTLATPAQARDAGRMAGPEVITEWNAIADRTVFVENANPIPSSSLYFSFVSIAMFDAVVAIDGGYQTYAYHGRAPSHASAEVAAATAAHRILKNYFPSSRVNLDA